MITIKYSRNEKETTTEFWAAVVTMLLKADCEILEVKIIQAINTKIDTLERERNVYLNLLCRDISVDTEKFILTSLREINEDIVYLQKLQEEVLNGNEDNS